jgi:4-aminobutyrate aminotransferase-like enzyme
MLIFVAGEIANVDGKRFIDLAGGLGVLNVGRVSQEILDAILGDPRTAVAPEDYLPPLGTGELFAIEGHAVPPDLVSTAKSLAAGRPPVGMTGPVASASALAELAGLTATDVLERARAQGRTIWQRMRPLEDAFGIVGEVKRRGPMVDLELVVDERTREPNEPAADAVVKRCHENGVLVLKAGTHDNVVRLLGPPVIPEDDLHEGLEVLTDALEWANRGMPAS